MLKIAYVNIWNSRVAAIVWGNSTDFGSIEFDP